MKLIDELITKMMDLKSPIVVGLDPVVERIPDEYFIPYKDENDEFKKIGAILFDFNKDIIDSIYDLVPAVKPQIAFYEMYGYQGVRAFEETVKYAKQKGLIVIEDGKRNDIGNTALAYANGHLGKVKISDSKTETESFNVDFLTVSPYLGRESLEPFIDVCIEHDKGIFILVKTSNQGNEQIQNVINDEGNTISEVIAKYVASFAEATKGKTGYSAIGAVVGATYPEEAKKLRNIMKSNLFLVPGYGTQGGDAKSIMPCFNEDGLGAIVNASRSIIFGYEEVSDKKLCTKNNYKEFVRISTKEMQNEIYTTLKNQYPNMNY